MKVLRTGVLLLYYVCLYDIITWFDVSFTTYDNTSDNRQGLRFMRAPTLLRPCTSPTTFVNSTQHYEQEYAHISLPVRDVVATLDRLMLDVQRRVHPTVTIETQQSAFDYGVSLRWQSTTDQLQLQGHADQLGMFFWLTDSLGVIPWERGTTLATWVCKRMFYRDGGLRVYRHEGRNDDDNIKSTRLTTTLPVFESVPRYTAYDHLTRQPVSQRPDLIDDIVDVVQIYASALG